MIRDYLLPLLEERFPQRFTIAPEGMEPCVTFPARHPEVGDVEIHDEGDEVTLVAGLFTHGHFSNYEDVPLAEREREIAEDVVDFLSKLFADQVVLWGSHMGGGGWLVIDPADFDARTYPNGYVWSGPLNQ